VRPAVLAPLAVLAVACRAAGSSPVPEARADDTPRSAGDGGAGAAVVELFTSEGCSSCPPADGVLASLAADPRVFALSFHVDYWDELGWPDRFSSPESTARQRAYAASFGTRSLYTPQLVIGGSNTFVGSDREHAASSVAAALARPAAVSVSLAVHASASRSIAVETLAPGAPDGAVVNVAIVERSATTQVRAGENAGRTLRHVDVVRAFASRPAPAGTVTLDLPASLRREDAEIVAFVQRPASAAGGMPVLGAARASIPRE
jgi:hypothetical protein